MLFCWTIVRLLAFYYSSRSEIQHGHTFTYVISLAVPFQQLEYIHSYLSHKYSVMVDQVVVVSKKPFRVTKAT
jgi:hypothetical protein